MGVKDDEKTGGEEKKKADGKQDLYLRRIFLIMIIILASAALIFFNKPKADSFEYLGMEFNKVMFGEIPLYRTTISVSNKITGEVIGNYEIDFRNDPREMDNIDVIGKVRLTKNTIVALDQSMTENNCVNSPLAGLNLGKFLDAFGIKIVHGTTNKSEAGENLVYASCETSGNRSVIITEAAGKTEIFQENANCYKIRVNNCEVVQATEKFMIEALAQLRRK